MALARQALCSKCGQEFVAYDTGYFGHVCPNCTKAEEQEKKQIWLNSLRDNKTLEERISKLEEMMYDQKNHEHFNANEVRF